MGLGFGLENKERSKNQRYYCDILVVETSVSKPPFILSITDESKCSHMYEGVCTIDCCADHKVCVQWWSGHKGGASETGREH